MSRAKVHSSFLFPIYKYLLSVSLLVRLVDATHVASSAVFRTTIFNPASNLGPQLHCLPFLSLLALDPSDSRYSVSILCYFGTRQRRPSRVSKTFYGGTAPTSILHRYRIPTDSSIHFPPLSFLSLKTFHSDLAFSSSMDLTYTHGVYKGLETCSI